MRDLVIQAIRAAGEVPPLLRELASEIGEVEELQFDESYIAFLDQQIELDARGSDWADLLTRRRAALLPFCGLTLLRGRVQVGDAHFMVRVDPRTGALVHWEQW